nr:MAG: hypothetical protein [Metapenaeopsis lamellata majanivirus]
MGENFETDISYYKAHIIALTNYFNDIIQHFLTILSQLNQKLLKTSEILIETEKNIINGEKIDKKINYADLNISNNNILDIEPHLLKSYDLFKFYEDTIKEYYPKPDKITKIKIHFAGSFNNTYDEELQLINTYIQHFYNKYICEIEKIKLSFAELFSKTMIFSNHIQSKFDFINYFMNQDVNNLSSCSNN